ncbi:siderophore-interacting protein [Clostridium gasigenes]|uniref:Siderophore-interacting protein n=1 Tax=Clostridium gasigenes TaxID=94869 RepID=A0A7X0SEY0_9CLOT|nr:siderophore-interacting protein [Clostridium gasigenes]MBB6716353.1 siderophore-interacting protein [Clostridium gasigenes]
MSKELKDKARTMLNSYIIYKSDIKNIELEMQEIQNNYDINALSYGESSSKTYKISQESQDRIANKDMQLKKMQLEMDNNKINVAKIDNAVATLKEFERDVIVARYLIEPTSWEMVARKLGFAKISCQTAEDRAVRKMIPLLFR